MEGGERKEGRDREKDRPGRGGGLTERNIEGQRDEWKVVKDRERDRKTEGQNRVHGEKHRGTEGRREIARRLQLLTESYCLFVEQNPNVAYTESVDREVLRIVILVKVSYSSI